MKRHVTGVLVLGLAACGGGSYEHEGTYESKGGMSSWTSRGVRQVELKNYEEAIRLFHVAIVNDPNDTDAYYHLGNTWVLKGDGNRAVFFYSEAIRVDAHHKQSYFKRGWVLHNMIGDLEGALADFTDAIEEDSHYADAYLWRGQTFRALKVFNSALADIERALREAPGGWTYQEQAERWVKEVRQQVKAAE